MRAHVREQDETGLLDLAWWQAHGPKGAEWAEELRREENPADLQRIPECTYAGRPFGDEEFVQQVGECHGRRWVRGRPGKAVALRAGAEAGSLFVDDDVA